MLVQSISPNLFAMNNKNNKINMNPMPVSHSLNSSTIISDNNYGKLLIMPLKVNFKGKYLPEPVRTSLTTKISAALNLLESQDLLLIGRDISTAKTALKSNLKLFPMYIKKVLFIKDDKIERNFAITKNNTGFDKITNLSKEPALLKSQDFKEQILLVQGESRAIMENDKVVAKGSSFDIKYEKTPDITEIQAAYVSKFDFIEKDKESLRKINEKNIQEIGVKQATNRGVKKITFSNVAGQDAAISEIRQKIIRPIKYPNFFKNIKVPKTILFVGPPGNAKTLTAIALSNEIDVPFYAVNGQMLEGMYIGESAHNIHEYYDNARKNQPCIMFFDEIEAILGKRTGKHKYADDSVNMHLDEISQLEKENANVWIIGATNKPHLMEDAALRDGRFGVQVHFDNPDLDGCRKIFDVHTQNESEIIEDFDKDAFAKKLFENHVSGANIEGIVQEARINSIERQGIYEAMDNGTFVDNPDFKLVIKGEDFDKALDKFKQKKELLETFEQKDKIARKDEIKEELSARHQAEEELKPVLRKRPKRIEGFVKKT